MFWRMFDRTDTGACVAIQTLPYGMDDDFDVPNEELTRYRNGPVFVNCKTLNYYACEAKGKKADYLLDVVTIHFNIFCKLKNMNVILNIC